jgi:hypothetical protein
MMAEASEAAVVVPARLELRSETCLVAPWSAATAASEQLAPLEVGAAIAEAAKRAVMKVSLNCIVTIEKKGRKRPRELRRLKKLDIDVQSST